MRFRAIHEFFAALTRNPVSLVGTAIATASILLVVTLFTLQLLGFHGGPYIGILTFLVLPALCVLGLLIIPIGIARERRRTPEPGAEPGAQHRYPVIDLNRPKVRNGVLIFLALTAVNVVVLAAATYEGIEVMDSNEFCGLVCHRVMQPEHTAHQRSPHSRVDCADCHIGPGADWFVKSKLSGAWQVVAVTFDLYPRPIPTPIEDLRPARDTCEQCHWPTKFVGDKLKVLTHYEEDEENTELKSVVLLKVGGIQGRSSSGIHWHVDPNVQIRYRSDESRETIYDVELTQPDGTVKLYKNGDVPEDANDWRTMDCVDCHNRPTHRYGQPGREVDLAILDGLIDRSLPFIKREAMKALMANYDSHEQARAEIATAIQSFYAQSYPELAAERGGDIEEAASQLGDIYAQNVFPHMNVGWGTYPDHIGHTASPGCFRCHDRKHRAENRERIDRDCSTCHTLLAAEEENPSILEQMKP